MSGRICNSLNKSGSSDCDHKRQVMDGDKRVGAKWVVCESCVEDNKLYCCNGDTEANCSFAHAVINMIGMLIGLGQLSTPYALQNGGWSTITVLVVLGIICGYTSHLLGKCLDKCPKSTRTYSDIGQQAFGNTGKLIATTFIYMEIFMALVSYTISLHDNIATIFEGTRVLISWSNKLLASSQVLTIIAVLVAIPSLWLRNMSSISFLSSAGIFMAFLIFMCVAFTALFGYVKPDRTLPFLYLQNFPSISGLYMFSYAGHIVFPNLYKSMKDPCKFTKVSIVSFSAATILYTSLAFMGAKMFGAQVSSQITLSMPRNVILTKIALWATVLTPMTKYALEFAPFAIQLEHCLPQSLSSNMKMIIRGSIGSAVLLLILALALCVPYFEHVLGLTGSLVSVGICIVLPCAFYIKISWPQISKSSLILNFALIIFGFLLGIVGTISSSRLLVITLLRAHST